jgi:hypothetical protein
MIKEPDIQSLANRFWERAGRNAPYPRNMWVPVQRAFPITIRQIHELSVNHVYADLSSIGYSDPPDTPDRRLRGCLVALQGYGIIFLDAADLPEERNFSLAHEASHFIIDHWQPREAVRKSISPNALEAFDGERAPTVVERFKGIRNGIAIRPLEHFMDRDPDGNIRVSSFMRSENKADRLALELLAPALKVVGRQRFSTRPKSGDEIVDVLKREFGLPAPVALSYGEFLFLKYIPDSSLRERFGVK